MVEKTIMSTIYKNLIDEEIQSGKSTGIFLETERTQELKLRGVKAAILVLFVAAAVAFVGSWMIYQKWTFEKERNTKLEAEQMQLRDKAQSFDNEVKDLNEEITGLRQKLAVSENSIAQMKDQLSAKDGESEAYQKEISGLKTERNSLDEKVRALEDQLAAASPVMKNFVTETTAVSAPATGAVSTPVSLGKQSKILTVNRQFNFVVINLGFKDRLRVGDRLVVEKDGVEIGTVEVEKSYEHFSAATIINEGRKTPFQEGFSVRRV
jgi:predicted RNase H-like nuclease (RuvC/YqgF family)